MLFNGDCLNIMAGLHANSIDMICADLPYGTTHCKWDSIIDLEKLFREYERIIKPNGAIVLFGQQPFTSKLIACRPGLFKYQWLWVKNRAPNFMMAKYCPLKITEDILVFSKGGINQNTKNKMVYYPQGTTAINKVCKSNVKKSGVNIYNSLNKTFVQTTTGYPTNILKFDCESGLHPTQKPVPLLEYLIKTYTKPGEVVLDSCMGSGSTGVACANTGRLFVGIELDGAYFDIAKQRIEGVH